METGKNWKKLEKTGKNCVKLEKTVHFSSIHEKQFKNILFYYKW